MSPRRKVRAGIGTRLTMGLGGLILLFTAFAALAHYRLKGLQSQVDVLGEEWEEGEALQLFEDTLDGLAPMFATPGQVDFDQLVAPLEEGLRVLSPRNLATFYEERQGGRPASDHAHEGRERELVDRLVAQTTLAAELISECLARREMTEAERVELALRCLRVRSAVHAIRREDAAEVREAWLFARNDLAQLNQILVAAVAGCLVASFLISMALYRGIKKPLKRMRDLVCQFAESDFSARMDHPANDEMGELARELNSMASKLEDAYAALESRVREKSSALLRASKLAGMGTLASGLAHEVNNPLNNIGCCASALGKKVASVSDAERALFVEYLRIISEETNRAAGIVRSLLEFAGSTSGKKTLINLGDVLNQVVSVMGPFARSQQVTMEACVSPDILVWGNPEHLRQVFLNLIKNAIEASAPGQSVEVRTKSGDEAMIEVCDKGSGFDEEATSKLFDPFYTTKHDHGGSGLGLSVCYGIIEDHDGEIHARSDGRARGASFVVRLPRHGEVE